MASGFVTAYSVGALFATHLQKDLGLNPGMVALPIMLQSLVFFFRPAPGACFPICSAAAGR